MEAMIDAGVHMGFSREVARTLVLKTMQGSVEYVQYPLDASVASAAAA